MKLPRKLWVLPRLNELIGLFMLFGVILLAMALVSYNPNDLSFLSRDSAQTFSRNLVGRFGATMAELLFQIFGLASYFLLVPLAIGGWRRLWSRKGVGLGVGLVGHGGILAGLLSLLAMIVGSVHVGGEEVLAGGVLGVYVNEFLVSYLNTAGAFVMSVAFMALGATVATHISFGTLLAAARKLASAAFRRARTWLAHWRETRRKRKLREQIVRKHAKKAAAAEAHAVVVDPEDVEEEAERVMDPAKGAMAMGSRARAASSPTMVRPKPAPKANCTPNFYFDSQGEKHFKPECF